MWMKSFFMEEATWPLIVTEQKNVKKHAFIKYVSEDIGQTGYGRRDIGSECDLTTFLLSELMKSSD